MSLGLEKARIYVDYREENSGIPGILESLGLIVIREYLEIGDYIIPGDIIIERKTAEDYINSLYDGRLFDQISRLREAYDNVILLIEGDIDSIASIRGREKHVYSSLASLIIDFDIKIIPSSSPKNSAFILEALTRRVIESKGGGRVVIHKKPKLETIRDWQLYIVSSFPGVGLKLADRILENFKTIEAFCTSSYAELQRILGEKRAEKVKLILKTPYESESRKSKSLEYFKNKNPH
ncbi:MAG: ERCC4 domain-containing protein [Acidilobaceae archaeon]